VSSAKRERRVAPRTSWVALSPDDLPVRPAELLDELALPVQPVGSPTCEPVLGAHMDGEQVALRASGHARCPADEPFSVGRARQGDDDAFAGLPGTVDAVALAVVEQRVVDPVGHPEEGELSQGAEVAGAEVVPECCIDAFGGIDVAVGHAPPDGLGSHVHELDLVGPPHDRVGDRLLLRDARDLLDDVVDRFEVLDVQRRDHRDPGVEERLDVLPPLLVA